ncbi:Hypothetical predicted protein [Paramuricea clavata]|uniref:Uncharacterized protein n=1 Tax=Paramuricea clavata TaxID=317549 RepID=A0A6S7I2P5_PARCT|nr:Hypothetical predicted protein [Paramuricea clavata]
MVPKPPGKSDQNTKGKQEKREHWPVNAQGPHDGSGTDEEESAVAAPTFPVEQKCDNHASKVLADTVPDVAAKSEVDGHPKAEEKEKEDLLRKGNAAFQHYYAKYEACAKNVKPSGVKCKTCLKVQ